MDIEQIRKDTPLHQKYAYINSAAESAIPKQVLEAMSDYLTKTSTIGPYLPAFRKEVYARIMEIRGIAARFIGASENEIAFIKNGTEGINFIASGIPWKDGDEVILANMEFQSNFVPWLRLQKERNIKLKVVNTGKDGLIDVAELERTITKQTRLITVSHLPNASGALQPIKDICSLAKRRNVLTFINASQTLGLVPIDVSQLECDFLAACGRKWLRGPEGSGILFVREELLPTLEPTIIGYGGTTWDFETNDYVFAPTAKKFEAGCLIIPSVLGMGAAFEYASKIGIEPIFDRVKMLTRLTVEKLSAIPEVSIYGPQNIDDRLAIVPFNVKGVAPDSITAFLAENDIIIESGSFMANTLLKDYGIDRMARLSPHYFNTEEEIERAVSLIKQKFCGNPNSDFQ